MCVCVCVCVELDFIFADSETTFQSTNQIWEKNVQFLSSLGLQPGLDASTSVLFTYHFPLILEIRGGGYV